MANIITFLKNYKDFGFKIRLVTAQNYLKIIDISTDFTEQKIMMLRILEELISSTEDLTMWLAAISERNIVDKKYRDEWEYLLVTEATDDRIVKILRTHSRIKTGKGLLKRFKTPPFKRILSYLKTDEATLMSLVNKLLEAIKASLKNRTVSKKVLIRFHNKVKHGMVVQDYGNELFIRDLKPKLSKKRLIRRNRNLIIPFDQERAKKMVRTIETNAYAIKTIIILLMADYSYQLETRKRKLGKRQKEFWADSLNQP